MTRAFRRRASAPGFSPPGDPPRPRRGPRRSRGLYWVVVVVVVAVVVGGADAHLPSTGSTSPWRLWALTACCETEILTNLPELPALWQIVTFFAACFAFPFALPLPCSDVVVAAAVVVAATASFFPWPWPPPLSASAYEDAMPATNRASVIAFSFIWSRSPSWVPVRPSARAPGGLIPRTRCRLGLSLLVRLLPVLVLRVASVLGVLGRPAELGLRGGQRVAAALAVDVHRVPGVRTGERAAAGPRDAGVRVEADRDGRAGCGPERLVAPLDGHGERRCRDGRECAVQLEAAAAVGAGCDRRRGGPGRRRGAAGVVVCERERRAGACDGQCEQQCLEFHQVVPPGRWWVARKDAGGTANLRRAPGNHPFE